MYKKGDVVRLRSDLQYGQKYGVLHINEIELSLMNKDLVVLGIVETSTGVYYSVPYRKGDTYIHHDEIDHSYYELIRFLKEVEKGV